MADIIVIGINPNNIIIGKLIEEKDSTLVVEAPIAVSYVMQPDGSIGQAVGVLDPVIGIDGQYEIRDYKFKITKSEKLAVYKDLYDKVIAEIKAKQTGLVLNASEKDMEQLGKQLSLFKTK